MNTLALCIPAFNAAAFLPRLLTSARKQSVPFDEILVYDDCSTDDTAAVAQSLGANVVSGGRNLGCSAGKNKLLAITRCTRVHFHDADDDLTPAFTELAHAWMRKDDCPDVVLFDYESRSFDDERLLLMRRFDEQALKADAARYTILQQINPYCGVYSVEALRRVGGYDEDADVLYNEDCRFHMRLAFAGLEFGVEKKVAVINLERQGSMSGANKAKCAISRLAVLRKALAEAPKYRDEVGAEAWLNARQLAYVGCFREMKEAIALAHRAGVQIPCEETNSLVRWLASVSPEKTFAARAKYVRWRDRAKR